MISEARIDEVMTAVEDAGLSESLVSELRQRFAGLHLTYCMDDDVCGPEPVRAARGFNLYLVDSHAQCLRLTSDPARASGLVLAEVCEDEDGDPDVSACARQPRAACLSEGPGTDRDGG